MVVQPKTLAIFMILFRVHQNFMGCWASNNFREESSRAELLKYAYGTWFLGSFLVSTIDLLNRWLGGRKSGYRVHLYGSTNPRGGTSYALDCRHSKNLRNPRYTSRQCMMFTSQVFVYVIGP